MQIRSACPVLGVRGSAALFRLYQNEPPQMKQLKTSFYLLTICGVKWGQDSGRWVFFGLCLIPACPESVG